MYKYNPAKLIAILPLPLFSPCTIPITPFFDIHISFLYRSTFSDGRSNL